MTCCAQKHSVLPQLLKHNDVADYDAGKVVLACNGLEKASSCARLWNFAEIDLDYC
jgi:hypothetical protein